ncbi:fasciclin-like arabinogalactan protein 8 [Trifolium medium]|uniref:Fasciclin-like arabinogalactan protein 8 n=1 Tax=Trifolium medium TaxID=97028 RepID=A0A392M184_9FABA|nr:fasciclin-like arabinogalactan protein 8 [Trifolium medium]
MAKISQKNLFTSLIITTILLVCTIAAIINLLPNPSVTKHGVTENGRKLIDKKTGKTNRPLKLNKILLGLHDYNIATALLTATGFLKELEALKGHSGLTLFLPNDQSFARLPILLIKAHVCSGYYRLALLQSAVLQNLPTFATDATGAELYTLNISGLNGVVTLSTGIVEAKLVKILYDRKPIVVYGVPKVLLPKEIFGNKLV